ncbi:MAG: hypothetical protein ACYC3L_16310 [Gemmatimonadaceae bacterium]
MKPQPSASIGLGFRAVCTLVTLSVAGAVSCSQVRRVSPAPVAAYPPEWMFKMTPSRRDTVRVTLPSPPSGDVAAMRQERDQARAEAARYREQTESSGRQFRMQRTLANARGDSLRSLPSDSARVDGYREMLEGLPYVFTLSLARNMVLPAKVLATQAVLSTSRVPALADSARVCLSGDGFRIVADERGADQNCSVQEFLPHSQRQWSWTVTPDSIDRQNFRDPVDRVLIFTVTSYTLSAEPAPSIIYPVRVRVRPRPPLTMISEFVKTGTGIVTLLTGFATAVGLLWAAVGFGRRKGAAAAAAAGGG